MRNATTSLVEKKENKKYKSLLGLIDGTYPTMTTVSEEEATKVSIWGNGNFTPQFKDNFYKGSNGEMVESLEIDLGMGNFTIKEPHQVTPDQYKAEFTVTVFVHDVFEETNKEEQPTGRAKVQAYVPTYNGKVFPITLVAGKVVDQTGEEYDFGQDERLRLNNQKSQCNVEEKDVLSVVKYMILKQFVLKNFV